MLRRHRKHTHERPRDVAPFPPADARRPTFSPARRSATYFREACARAHACLPLVPPPPLSPTNAGARHHPYRVSVPLTLAFTHTHTHVDAKSLVVVHQYSGALPAGRWRLVYHTTRIVLCLPDLVRERALAFYLGAWAFSVSSRNLRRCNGVVGQSIGDATGRCRGTLCVCECHTGEWWQ